MPVQNEIDAGPSPGPVSNKINVIRTCLSERQAECQSALSEAKSSYTDRPMSEQQPDKITVQATFEEELAADRAVIDFQIAGESFWSGDEALARAREVREVVDALKQTGIAEADITLRDVVAETQKGVFTDSSSARYTLRAVCRDLNRVADVLVQATRPKHTTLSSVDWRFPDDPAFDDERVAKALVRANRRAAVMAEALGVAIRGVISAQAHPSHGGPAARPLASGANVRQVAMSTSDTLDMGVVRTTKVGAQARVEYRIGPKDA